MVVYLFVFFSKADLFMVLLIVDPHTQSQCAGFHNKSLEFRVKTGKWMRQNIAGFGIVSIKLIKKMTAGFKVHVVFNEIVYIFSFNIF